MPDHDPALHDPLQQRLDNLGARCAADAPPLPHALLTAVHARRPRPWRWPAALAATLALAAGVLYFAQSPPSPPISVTPHRFSPDTIASLTAAVYTSDPLDLPLRDLPTATSHPPLLAGDLLRLSVNSILEH